MQFILASLTLCLLQAAALRLHSAEYPYGKKLLGNTSVFIGDGWTSGQDVQMLVRSPDFAFIMTSQTYYGGTLLAWGANCMAIEDPISSHKGLASLSLTIHGKLFAVRYPKDAEPHVILVSFSSANNLLVMCIDTVCNRFQHNTTGHDKDAGDIDRLQLGHGKCKLNSTGTVMAKGFFRGNIGDPEHFKSALSDQDITYATQPLQLALHQATMKQHKATMRLNFGKKEDVMHESLSNRTCVSKASRPHKLFSAYLIGNLRSFTATIPSYHQRFCDLAPDATFDVMLSTSQTVDSTDIPWRLRGGKDNKGYKVRIDNFTWKGSRLTPPADWALKEYARRHPKVGLGSFCFDFSVDMVSETATEAKLPKELRGQQEEGLRYARKLHKIRIERLAHAHQMVQAGQPDDLIIVSRPDYKFAHTYCEMMGRLEFMRGLLKKNPMMVFAESGLPKTAIYDQRWVTSRKAMDHLLATAKTFDPKEGMAENMLYGTMRQANLTVLTGYGLLNFIQPQETAIPQAPGKICHMEKAPFWESAAHHSRPCKKYQEEIERIEWHKTVKLHGNSA
eukprot:gnl/TRDRNA2_/TRDRNA2_175805_c0_seq1.p1 gnl/TRDRNA2_/TRDRNA2_175805_c0~~gnl/TRDRNA2_/TRDRNA2_175805_c0_seq1.p1  ORF type:complete len:562 (-),score=69.75 gnl/TRDRNA2_/TRDRNA2_175805_c0_seq1:105-1790(-)